MAIALALGVPVIFLLCGAMGRKLMRGTAWQRSDFFLGVELVLATFSSNVLFITELVRAQPIDSQKALTSAASLVFIFGIYIFLLTLHQDWEKKNDSRSGQIVRLVIFSNIVGTITFATFVFLIKGVR